MAFISDSAVPLLVRAVEREVCYDYVLMFANPVDMPDYNYTPKSFSAPIEEHDALHLFQHCFRLPYTEPTSSHPVYELLRGHMKEIRDLYKAFPTGITKKFIVEIVLSGVLKVLQEDLSLDAAIHLSCDREHVFVKLASNEENLKVQADLSDYKLQLHHKSEQGKKYQDVAPYGPFEKDTGNSEKFLVNSMRLTSNPERHFKRYGPDGKEHNEGQLFKKIDRIRLVRWMLNSVLDIGELTADGLLLATFPLHNKQALDQLSSRWLSARYICGKQQLDSIRDYFGEKIAIYFAWLEFYTWWFVLPAVIGVAAGTLMYVDSDLIGKDSKLSLAELSVLVFALLLTVGTTFLDQLWIRKQHRLA